MTKEKRFAIIIELEYAGIAQLVEQLICNQQVGGSSPSTSSNSLISYGSVPEWPKGTDCKSAGDAFGGSNPPAPTKTKRQFTQVDWRFVLVLFSFHLSLFTLLLASVNGVLREKIREKSEKKWSNPILAN